jgi:hypothetical protein
MGSIPMEEQQSFHLKVTAKSEPGSRILISSITDSIAVTMENAVVESVFVVDSVSAIILRGQYEVVYSNIFLKRGQTVKRGAPIGILATSDGETLLNVSVKKSYRSRQPTT